MRVSVVINTYNRFHSLRTTIESLQHQTHDDFEVVVVNGPSEDNTESLRGLWEGRLVWRQCPVVNISVSRNIGINAAHGEIVAFIDDDAIPEPDWIAKLVGAYKTPSIAGAGGIVWDHTGMKLQYRFSLCDRMGRTRFVSEQPDYKSIGEQAETFVYLQGTNSSFRRRVLEQVGGFDEEIEYFHDETDLAARINDAGFSLVPLPDGAVHHKYLASHLRTTERTVLEPYPIVKNSYYFAMLNGHEHYSADEIAAHLARYSTDVQRHAEDALASDRMNHEQFKYFSERVQAAQLKGTQLGLSRERKLGRIEPVQADDFVRFPTRNAEDGRLVTCFISNEYPPENFGGIGRFTKDLAEEMAAQGHQVHVVTHSNDCDRIDWENGVWLHRIRSQTERIGTADLQAIPYKWNLAHCASVYEEVLRLHDRFPLDVISSPLWASEGLLCSLDDRLPSCLTLMTSQKTLGEIDSTLGASQIWKQQVALERQSTRSAKCIHAISHAILEKTLADYGPTKAMAEVCYLGVRDESANYPRSRQADDPTIEVLYVGRLERRKGTDLLLQAARTLCEENARVRFTLIGKDNSGNGKPSYQDQFAEEAQHLIESGRVVFRGAVPDEELYQAYANADVMVLPSRFESFGLVLIEALCFGTPVVASQVGGMEEIVYDGVNGCSIQPDSVESLLNGLRSVVGNDQLRSQLRIGARRLFEEKWNLSIAARRTGKLYSKFADQHRSWLASLPAPNADYWRTNVAERLCRLAHDEASLVPLSLKSAQHLISPRRSTELLQGVMRAWYRSKPRFVQKVFKSILNRHADVEAVNYFVKKMKGGVNRKEIVAHIANSDEARSLDLPTDWLDELPNTQSLERLPVLMPVVGTLVGVPHMWQPNGPVRVELRRWRQRRHKMQEIRKAAS